MTTERLKRFSWVSLLALLTTVVGALGDPSVLAFLPHRASMAIVIAGAVLQAVTRAITEPASPTPAPAAS